MKILAIDTSSKICSVTIFEDTNPIIELQNDDEKTHSVKLMPMVDKAFNETNLTLDDIDLLVCSLGPGSFTGVRIGIATIKAFADAKNIPVVGISSLEILAYNVKELPLSSNSLVCSMIDAKNENIYCGLYKFSKNSCNQLSIFAENIHTSIEKIKEIALEYNYKDIIFVGDATLLYKDLLVSSFTTPIFAEDNIQKGSSIAIAGYFKYSNKEYGDSSSLSPIYLKKSQAERTLEEKIKIYEMTQSDIDLITPNFSTEFDEFWNINTLQNDFNNPNSTYFIAKLDDEIVGFAGFLKICDEANIMNIVTKINKRNLGVGSKLLTKLFNCAKDKNCTSITLEVNDHNSSAIHLYEKFGFKRIGLRKKYYNNTDDAIIMSIKL